jgi:hypothetical protein
MKTGASRGREERPRKTTEQQLMRPGFTTPDAISAYYGEKCAKKTALLGLVEVE